MTRIFSYNLELDFVVTNMQALIKDFGTSFIKDIESCVKN